MAEVCILEKIKLILKFLKRLGDQDVVIAVGAHIGSFSLKARSLGARKIYSFEADSDNFRLL